MKNLKLENDRLLGGEENCFNFTKKVNSILWSQEIQFNKQKTQTSVCTLRDYLYIPNIPVSDNTKNNRMKINNSKLLCLFFFLHDNLTMSNIFLNASLTSLFRKL